MEVEKYTDKEGKIQPDNPNFKVDPEVSHKIIEILQMQSSSAADSSEEDEDEDSSEPEPEDFHQKAVAVYKANQATNREAFGTWNRPLDFTLTLIGYIIGIHNLFRFPHLCYKYGTLTFLISYTIMIVVIGIPVVFMECTIGQYYGVGSITAFGHLAPIITGVSYILAWNSFINCWMYGIVLTWLRAYSGDSLSCLKGWVGCHEDHYYNTPYCWTATLDRCCAGEDMDGFEVKCPFPKSSALGPDSIYFNYKCAKIQEFCDQFGWTYIPGTKECRNAQNKTRSIYRRRFHATYEYFYGYVLGMRKVMVKNRKDFTKAECIKRFNRTCNSNVTKEEKTSIDKEVNSKQNVEIYWNDKGQRLQVDPDSSSFIQLPTFAFTTVLFITFFLFDNLLSVSSMTYILNCIPFLILVYLAILSLQFPNASKGVEDLLSIRGILNLEKIDIWVESIVQVLVTTGVGNGALISLASFNKYHHSFFWDVLFVMGLNIVTSIVATVICFCTIGHYLKEHSISEKFETFIQVESHYSSIEFAFITYSHFLIQIDGLDITTLLFFLTISSFPTDTAIRLAQNVLDATVQILPRLRFHSFMALLAVSVFYLLTLLPVTRNGGVVLFMEYEYFALYYAIPIITFIEVVSVGWVYQASRVVDNAEQLGVVSHHLFRAYFILSAKYATPILLMFVVFCNLRPVDERFRNEKSDDSDTFTTCFGWLFCLTPILLFLLSALKQLAAFPKSKWTQLFHPTMTSSGHKDAITKSRRDLFHHRMKSRRIGMMHAIASRGTDTSDMEHEETKRMTITGNQDDNEVRPNLQRKKTSVSRSQLMRKWKKEKGPDETSIGSTELSNLKSYLFWYGLTSYLEDWPDRLDDTEIESEGSSVPTTDDEGHHHHHHHHHHHVNWDLKN